MTMIAPVPPELVMATPSGGREKSLVWALENSPRDRSKSTALPLGGEPNLLPTTTRC